MNFETLEIIGISDLETAGEVSYDLFNKILSEYGNSSGLLPEQVPKISESDFIEMMAIYKSIKSEEDAEALFGRLDQYVASVVSGEEPTFNFPNFIKALKHNS